MSRHDLSIEVFLDRLLDMPDIEAVQEIDHRLVRIEESRREILGEMTEAARTARETLNCDETRLRSERHLRVMRMDGRKWSKAVRALWGDEGLEQCLIWFETAGEPEVKQVALRPKGRGA
jgi:hypothetical protein